MPDAIEGAEYKDTVFGQRFTVVDVRTEDGEPCVELDYEESGTMVVNLDTFKNSDGMVIDSDSV